MARKKSSMVMNASLEVETGGPLDAREVVDTLTDLTDPVSFPYVYEGQAVYVKSEKRAYAFVGDDPAVIENWKEIWVDNEHVELTQAEYDALSTEEKNNGKVYFITDGGAYVPAIDIIPHSPQDPIVVGKFDLRGDGEYRNIYRVRRWISDLKNANPIITVGWTEQGVYVRPLRIYGFFTFHDYENTATGWRYIIQQFPIPYSGYAPIEAPPGSTIGLKFYVDHNNKLKMVAEGQNFFNQDDFASVVIDYIETPIT